jgi:alpha-mannosidase
MAERTVKKRYYTPGFHSDVIWLEDQRDYAVVLMGCLGQNLRACEADPGYGVFLHEVTYLKPYLDCHPEDRRLFRSLLAAGRIGLGGAHSLPSENLISGEAIVRNFAWGRVYHEALGDRPEVAMLWDVFGHCSQLPQMLLGLRFSGLIWSKDIRGVPPLFWHLGPDGSRLLTRRVMYGHLNTPRVACEKHLDEYLAEVAWLGHEVDLRLDCGDFKPPTAWLVGRCRELAEQEFPWLVSGQAHRHYFREIHEAIAQQKFMVPTSGRDLEYHHQGTGLTHIDLKILNRQCENLLVEAEKWSTLAALRGMPYPHLALDKAWRQVFFGQHHDAITGPCCDRSYVDLLDGYREARELASAAREDATGYLARLTDTAGPQGGLALVVHNSCNWPRQDVVTAEVTFETPWEGFRVVDAGGQAVTFEVCHTTSGEQGLQAATVRFVAQVPGLGQATYWLVPDAGPMPAMMKRKGHDIENQRYFVRVDPRHGGIVSLLDKRLGRELLTGEEPGNELVALAEDFTDHPEPPWELNTCGPKTFSRDYKATIEVIEGPLSATLVVRGKFKDCRREQRITLFDGVERIELTTELQGYQGREDLLAVTFPCDLPGVTPVFDDRFGCVVKRRGNSQLDYRTWQWRNYSGGGARRTYQWVDLSHSARLLTTRGDKQVAAYALGPLSLVVGGGASGEGAVESLQQALVGRGVPCTIFRDDCDRQERWCFERQDSTMPEVSPDEDLPWGTGWRIIADVADTNLLWLRLRESLSAETLAEFTTRRTDTGAAVLLAEDSQMPEDWPPLPTLVVSGSGAEQLAAACNEMAAQLQATGQVTVPADHDLTPTPGQLPDWGMALLNRGTPMASLDADGTLTLLLMHCVSWARTPWGPDRLDFHLVAEHKTHRFEYALTPHKGSWREGRIPHAAYEYNNPLTARQEAQHGGPLVARGSLVEVRGGIVTSLRPAGYPLARYGTPPPLRESGLALRVYEPYGQTTRLRVGGEQPLERAAKANLLDEPQAKMKLKDGWLSTRLKPWEIATYVLSAPVQRPRGAVASLAPVTPTTESGVLPARPFRHNLGAEPMGNLPVVATLQGEVQTDTHVAHGGFTVNKLSLGVANNLPRPVRGTVRLVVGEGWRTVPESVSFALRPQEGQRYPVTLLFESGRREGLVRAQWEWEGQQYEDVLVVGEPPAPRWKVRLAGDRVVVRVSNPGEEELVADLYLVAPHEQWGTLGPRRLHLQLAPGEKRRYAFDLTADPRQRESNYWIVAKLAYWGRVEYKPVVLA